jgi:hypothetical protein
VSESAGQRLPGIKLIILLGRLRGVSTTILLAFSLVDGVGEA